MKKDMKDTNANDIEHEDNPTDEIKAPKKRDNNFDKMEQTINVKAKKITSKRKFQPIAKEMNCEPLEKFKATSIPRKNCLEEDKICPQIIVDNLSKGISEGKKDSEINTYINQYQMNKSNNSFLGRKRKDCNKKCTTAIIQIINNSSHDFNLNESKEKEIKKNNDVDENNEISEPKINKEETMIEIINVLLQSLLDIKNICVKALNKIIEIKKSLDLPIKIGEE